MIDSVKEDLEYGPYGIQQPKSNRATVIAPEVLDLVVVPGVAFDRSGHRLGRGAGFYDRFLADLPRDIPTVGLAFDFQIVSNLPLQEHDIPLSFVISN